jgi:dihydrofolate reductase
MIISIVVAIANNWVIGRNNALPWNLPADMEHFRKLTSGKPVIVGQKTYESIGKPLPGRTNIIITLNKNYTANGCLIVHSIEESLAAAKDFEEVMVIGGASIYEQFLPLADRLYLTLIDANIEGDTFFPEFDYSDWNEVERVKNEPDKENIYPYTFLTLERKK